MLETFADIWHRILSIPHLGWYLVALWLTYLVWIGLWVVLQKREPAATLSWLISLATLPYLGFLIYYFLGPQRIKRQRLRRGRARVALPKPLVGSEPTQEALELAKLGQAATQLPPTTATCAELIVDGAAKYEQLLAAIAEARDHVHLEYYIYDPDITGTALRDALIERARAGIKVRLLVDAVGSGKINARWVQPLLDAGGEFCWFHPVRWTRFWRRPWLNLRTHRKIVVIDGRVAFTGGINITDDQDERLRADAYRDLHLRIEGDAVQVLQLVFIEDWAYATGKPPLRLATAPARPGPVATQVVTSGPDAPWEPIHRLHVSAIHSASRRVWLVTPYFVPGEAARMALTSAALGGLDVRLLVPKMSDSRLVTMAARSYYDELLEAGVQVYEYGPRLLHSKALLCDDDLALVGSANFDNRSFRLNFEVQVLFRDAGMAQVLADHIETECAACTRVRHDRNRPLWTVRLPEALARLVSPVL